MARPTRLVLMFGSVLSFALAAPAPSDAGLIPWAYDAIFGPVGSIRANRIAYRSAYSGYGSYGAYGTGYSGYAATSYAPVTMASYGGGGCSSCNQSSYYAPAVSYDAFYGAYPSYSYGASNCSSCGNCNSCPSGNCSLGSNCSNCSVNSAPTSSGYGTTTSGYVGAPTPDPNNTRDSQTRFQEIEQRLNRMEHRQTEDEKFLKKQHSEYQPAPFGGQSTYSDSVVPPRRNTTFGSGDPADPSNSSNFERPTRGRNQGPAPARDPEEERRKPELAAPTRLDEKSKDQEKDETGTFKETEPQTLLLNDRATSQAVAPRERMRIATKQSKTAIVQANKPATKTSSQDSAAPALARK